MRVHRITSQEMFESGFILFLQHDPEPLRVVVGRERKAIQRNNCSILQHIRPIKEMLLLYVFSVHYIDVWYAVSH